MIDQIWIMLALYILGLGFILLFYPKISISLCIMSALFWGAVIYVFSALLLSFLGLYTGFIWVLISAEIMILLIMALKRKTVFMTVSWRNSIIWLMILFCLFGSVFLLPNFMNIALFTTDSKAYLSQGANIYNSSSIIAPSAGKFFREAYGIGEVLMHSLAGFVSQSMLTLWHPYLWITLYGSFFAILYESKPQFLKRKPAFAVISLLLTIWVGTAGLNWINGHYIHVHLITAASIFFSSYNFGKMISSDQEEPIHGFLGTLALCIFGVSRVESPIMIGLFLAMLLGAKTFSRKEIITTFFLPILTEIFWLCFILFAYQGIETVFWSDSRIIVALGAYILFALLIVIYLFNNNMRHIIERYLTNIIFVLVFNLSLWLVISRPSHQIKNATNILRQLFEGEIWGYYWWINLIIIASILILTKLQRKNNFSKALKFIGPMILVYLLMILDLGYFRKVYYRAWKDSASRMFSHISPIIGFYICESVLNTIPWKIINKK